MDKLAGELPVNIECISIVIIFIVQIHSSETVIYQNVSVNISETNQKRMKYIHTI